MARKLLSIGLIALTIVGCANQAACDDESYGELTASFAEVAGLIEAAEDTERSELPAAITEIEAAQQEIQAISVAPCAEPAKSALDALISAVITNFEHYHSTGEIDPELSAAVEANLAEFQSEMAELAEQ